jgi:hypothetical protein
MTFNLRNVLILVSKPINIHSLRLIKYIEIYTLIPFIKGNRFHFLFHIYKSHYHNCRLVKGARALTRCCFWNLQIPRIVTLYHLAIVFPIFVCRYHCYPIAMAKEKYLSDTFRNSSNFHTIVGHFSKSTDILIINS